MDGTITEKQYPIRNIWLFQQIFFSLFVLLIMLIGFFIFAQIDGVQIPYMAMLFIFIPFSLIMAMIFCIPLIVNVMKRSRFHYSFDEHFLTLHQGIFSKQNRNVPYGRIQEVFVHQDLFGRIFGLASLTIQDFSQGGISQMDIDGYVGSGKSRREILGFVGNGIHIPGLKKEDAEQLKAIVLQKIKENPIEDSQSGL
jgi:uncharacterized membrane protein YdbT with pleckstrin-like domain